MHQIFQQLEKFFPLLKNTSVPAVIFAVGLLGFYLYQPLEAARLQHLHQGYFVASLLSLCILFYFNRSKPVFFILITLSGYTLLNFLKRKYGEEYILSPEYVNLSIFLPFNLIILYYLPDRRLLTTNSLYILLLLFAEYALGEKLSADGISVGSSLGFETYASLNNLSILLFSVALAGFFITCSCSGSILDSALFFAAAEICLGFYYSPSPSAVTVFFGSAALTVFIAVCENLYNMTYHDPLTGLYSRNSFMTHAKDFPLKYSIGIILIDDYERLEKVFGENSLKSLIKMICNRITSVENEAQIYRYSREEFVVLFKGEDKNTAFERMETIRRAVASAEFILRGYKKPIKLTVSGSVSEKKRSDANAVEVLSRAAKAMQKAYRFTQNITSKA